MTIDCRTFNYPDVRINFEQSVEFFNACAQTRLLEFFDDWDKYRPVMFIQLEPNHWVTLVGGPDSDCHNKIIGATSAFRTGRNNE